MADIIKQDDSENIYIYPAKELLTHTKQEMTEERQNRNEKPGHNPSQSFRCTLEWQNGNTKNTYIYLVQFSFSWRSTNDGKKNNRPIGCS